MSIEAIAFICLAGIGFLVGGYLFTVKQFKKMSEHPEEYTQDDNGQIHLQEKEQ